MSSELMQMVDSIAKQRGLDKNELFEMITHSLRESAKRAIETYDDVDVGIDPKGGGITCTAKLKVVEKVEDRAREISRDMARTQFPGVEVGDEIQWPLHVENFGRIAAQCAKQFLTTGLQEAEKRHVVSSFESQEGQLLTGTILRKDRNGVWIEFRTSDGTPMGLQTTEGLMPPKGYIPGEEYEPNVPITVLLKTLNPDKPGASLFVTRSSPDFVRRLFEREVSEIHDGTVVIKSIAREPGYRTKIAVFSDQPKVDPMGACVGVRGSRVNAIVGELSGEKVDIIHWSPDIRTYVANALKPAKLARVDVDEANHTLNVKVLPDQLSLSIGKKGQNVRLANKLLGWKINIEKIEPEQKAESNTLQDLVNQAVNTISLACGIDVATAEILVGNGYHSVEGLREASVEDLMGLEGIDEAMARKIHASIHIQPLQ